MGSDKRSLRLFPASPTFLERTVAIGRAVADRVAVIGEGDAANPLTRVTLVPDRWPSEGPLGAIVTALESFPDDRLLVLACDYPSLQVELVTRVLAGLDGHDASVAVDGGRGHPLVAAYDARRCAAIAGALFAAGERSMAALIDRLFVRLVDANGDGRADVHSLSLNNVNTMGDLAKLRERCLSMDHRDD